MTNSTNLVKKAFSVAVAATTILWSVGLSAFLPVAASAATFGDLIKGTTLSTVYYYGSDGQRYAFPNEKTYFSWNKDFSAVKTISDSQLASITLAGNIVYRPGARWIKITSDNKVYVVSTSGKIRWVENEATAKGLGGDNWNAHIDDVPDVFFTNYTVGDSLTSAAAGYDGMLWSDGTSKYLVAGTKYQKLTDAGFAANGYNAGFVLMGTGFTKSGLTAGADITAAMSNLMDDAQKVTTSTYAVSQNVSVALSASSPATSTLVCGQAIANLAAFDFTNPTSAPVSVKSLKLVRTGVSADALLTNVYLFSGYVRLTDSATVSSGAISWNDAGGLFTIPAGGTVTVNARADVAASSCAGQTVGLKLVSASDVGFVGAFAAAGTFPIVGATHSTATATMASVTFGAAGSVDTAPSPSTDLKVWSSQVTVSGTNGVWLQAFRVRNTGSVNAADVNNWRLYVASVQRGVAVASQDANGYVTFDLSAAPIKLTSNTHEFKVVADVVGGTSRTIAVGLRSAADAIFVDNDYQQPILPTLNAVMNSAAQTIASGSLLFTKRSDSPSGNITAGASNAVLARYDVKATGEAMKIESLNLNWEISSSANEKTLRNGSVYADGNQIGNTTNLCGADVPSAQTGCAVTSGTDNLSYSTYNFGSSFVVYPGTPVVMEVRADIYDAVAGANLTSGSVQLQMFGTASKTVLRKATGDYVVPFGLAAQNAGNVLSVKQGSLTVAKNASYAAQTVVKPLTAAKLGSFTITSGSTEPVSITNFDVALNGSGSTGLASGEVNNLYVKYGPLANMTSLTVKSTPSVSAANSFSLDYTLQPNTTIYVDVYGDLDASMSGNEVVETTLATSAIAKNSGATVNVGTGGDYGSPKVGQMITVKGSGTFTPAKDGTSPVDFMTAGGQSVVAGNFSFSAITENFTINEVLLNVPSAAAAGTIDHVELYDGTTLLGSSPLAFDKNYDSTLGAGGWSNNSSEVATSVPNVDALISGLSVPVSAGVKKVLTVKLVLGSIGFGAGASHTEDAVALDGVKYSDSQGSVKYATGSSEAIATGNTVRVMKAVPVVNAVDLTNGTMTNGAETPLYKFTVTANGGDIALKQFTLATSWSDNGTADSLSMTSFKLQKNGADFTSSVTIADKNGNDVTGTDVTKFTGPTGSAETDSGLVVTFNSEDVISSVGSGTVTYTLYGTPQGFRTHGDQSSDSVSFSLLKDATTAKMFEKASGPGTIKAVQLATAADGTGAEDANFIWSDLSGLTTDGSHSDTSGSSSNDWANGYLVLSLSLPSESWSK